jgi:micrococcal nuclease
MNLRNPQRIRFAPLSLALALTPVACAAQQETVPGQSCVVSTVTDGDTFRCRGDLRVRMIGMDSPEAGQTPYGASARAALYRLLPPGSIVRLELDLAPTDRYGRTLAYVWADTSLVNEMIVREGWAVLLTVPPNVKYAERLQRAQKEARASGAGLWTGRGFECLPSDFRRRRCVSPP